MIPRFLPPQFAWPKTFTGALQSAPSTRIVTLHTYASGNGGMEHWVASDLNAVQTGAVIVFTDDPTFPTNGDDWADTVAWYVSQSFSGSLADLDCQYTQINTTEPSSSGPSGQVWKIYNGATWAGATVQGGLLRSVSGSTVTDLIVLYAGYQSPTSTTNTYYEKGSSNVSRATFLGTVNGSWAGGKWCDPSYAWVAFP